jgi:hypothetical protein
MEKKLIILIAAATLFGCSEPTPYERLVQRHYLHSLRIDVRVKDVTIRDAMTKEEVKSLFERKLKASKESSLKDTAGSSSLNKYFQSNIDNPSAKDFLTVKYQTAEGGPVMVSEFTADITGSDTTLTELY